MLHFPMWLRLTLVNARMGNRFDLIKSHMISLIRKQLFQEASVHSQRWIHMGIPGWFIGFWASKSLLRVIQELRKEMPLSLGIFRHLERQPDTLWCVLLWACSARNPVASAATRVTSVVTYKHGPHSPHSNLSCISTAHKEQLPWQNSP